MNTFHSENNAPADAAPVNILIVDDIAQNLIAMEALLRAEGRHVLLASSGAEALEMLLTHDVALALLDVQMPEMDGFALAELMRGSQKTRDVPIIFLTASPNDPLRSFKGYESGAVDFLHKPIDPYVIEGKVKVFIELYRQRQLLSEKNQQLEKSLKLNETMIAILSHDLRTPLSVIVLCADVLKSALGEGEFARNIAHMHTSAHRMSRMIGQLLEFSRIRSEVLQIEACEADLSEVADAVLDEVRMAHPDREFSLSVAGGVKGHFDRDRLAQVFSNLIGNALEHGDPTRPIEVMLDGTDQGQLALQVKNAGTVPEDLLPNLFDPFRSGKNSKSGLGLGLYIVDQFVRAHRGRVEVANVDDGVVFKAQFARHVPGVADSEGALTF
ncbi:MAG: hybrid sensor histidine kinase/response regulator [Rhodanobacter sp.]|nr:MAG: hybrid sensor histidine kinase/response regulator [Rhodanobacter sp.]